MARVRQGVRQVRRRDRARDRIGEVHAGELDEEEQNLERLQRWYRELRARDVLGAPSAPDAELRLKSSSERLEGFAQQVFERGGGA